MPVYDWMLPRLTDYLDSQADAVRRHSDLLRGLSPAERVASLRAIADSTARHCEYLAGLSADREALLTAAFCMAEDVYRYVGQQARVVRPEVFDYLRATLGCVCDFLAFEGYVVRYFIDNAFPHQTTTLPNQLAGLRMLFESAGFRFLCPQDAAFAMMDADGVPGPERFAALERYSDEGRLMAAGALSAVHVANFHYVYMDVDWEHPGRFLDLDNPSAGSLTIFRNQAPVPGSTCRVLYPLAPLPIDRRAIDRS